MDANDDMLSKLARYKAAQSEPVDKFEMVSWKEPQLSAEVLPPHRALPPGSVRDPLAPVRARPPSGSVVAAERKEDPEDDELYCYDTADSDSDVSESRQKGSRKRKQNVMTTPVKRSESGAKLVTIFRGASPISPTHRYSSVWGVVPYSLSGFGVNSLCGISVEKTMDRGNGVFWRGLSRIPHGVLLTVYPGKVRHYSPDDTFISLEYTIELEDKTINTPVVLLDAFDYAQTEPDLKVGVAYLINSCHRGEELQRQAANCCLQRYTSRGVLHIIAQSITEILPNTELLLDYHWMLEELYPHLICMCPYCITLRLED
jgi:hypothetical protein